MKSLIVSLFLFSCLSGLAQTKIDEALTTFINSHYYVRLTDTAHLTNIIPYLPIIKEHLSATHYGEPADIYVDAANVWENSNTIHIPIANINGIKALKHNEDEVAKLKKTKDTLINGQYAERLILTTVGDPAGKHNLIINKADGTLKYYMEQ